MNLEELIRKAEQGPIQPLPTAAQRRQARQGGQQSNNAGPAWFNMPAPTRTAEVEADLRLLEMRSALDPKQHYKRGTGKVGRFFQIGTIIEDPSAFYSDRLPRRQRASTLVDTLLRDEEKRAFLKRKQRQLASQTEQGTRRAYRQERVKALGAAQAWVKSGKSKRK